MPGLGEVAGAALSAHSQHRFHPHRVTPKVGALVQTAAAKNHIGCTLELGGKSPQIVFADADMDAALTTVAAAIIQNVGRRARQVRAC